MDVAAIPAAAERPQLIHNRRDSHTRTRRSSIDTRSFRDSRYAYPGSSLAAGSIRTNGYNTDLSAIPRQFIRQILGLNPFKTSYWSLYRPLVDVKSRCILILGIVCAIAAGIPLPIIGVIFSSIIDSFPPPEAELNKSIGELLGVAVAYLFLTWTWSICWGVTGENISRRMREALVEKAMGMDMTFYDLDDIDITGVLTSSTQTIQMGTSEKVGLFIQSISYFVAAFTVGFILNAKLTGILFAGVIPTMVIIVISGTTVVSKLSKQASEFLDNAANLAESAIGSVQVVQAFGSSKILSDQHHAVLRRAVQKGYRKSLAGAFMLGAVYFTCYAANALAFFEGSRLETDGAGTIYAVVFLILDASFVVGQFGPFIQTFAQAASSGSKVIELLDKPDPRIDPYAEGGTQCDEAMFDKDIVLKDISFWYPARATTRVLNAINLRFKAHTTTGIVGLSGSGKSTISSLLLRFYDPTKGQILIGDDRLTSLNLASYRSQIALVDQDPALFSGTILENIRHGIADFEEGLTEKEIFSRCKQAALDANADFITKLPQGIHTKIGRSGGTSLSGGQRQRICLARAIVRRPKIMILDEPTSALDTTSEGLILEALKKVSQSGCTVITIAHRLATIRDADQIVVMGHGQVLDQGTHAELLDHDGPYKTLVEAQGMKDVDSAGGDSTPVISSMDSSRSVMELDKLEKSFESVVSLESSNTPSDSEKSREKTPSIWRILRRCYALSRPERPLIFLGLFASIVSGAIVMAEAIIFGHLVALLNTDTGDRASLDSQVDFYCLMFFIVSLVALFAYSTSGSAFGAVSESLVLRIRDISLRTILKQDMAWFSTPGHSSHELMASINMDAGHLSGLSGVIIGTVFSVLTSILGGIILAHVVAWKIAVVLLAAVPVMVLAGFLRLRVLARFEERHETAYNEAAALASEACRELRTVAAFGRERAVLREYQAAIHAPYSQSFKFNVGGNFMLAFSLSITYFVYALAYYWGAVQVRDGNYSQQDFFIVLPALLFSAQASGQMFSLAPEITRARSAALSVFNLHDQRPTIMTEADSSPRGRMLGKLSVDHEKETRGRSSGSLTLIKSHDGKPLDGRVELDNVKLYYPSRPQDPVLQGLSLSIEPGQFIGIVGPSGAGKSSLISLLERFYDPTTGVIKVDNQDIREMKVSEYRNKLSLVAQEPDLFSGTIAFNIGLGARAGQQVTQEEIEHVCQECGVHEFVMSLPEGYQTECGYNGSKLSGGQKQRVAIARALIRNPEILLLDEATASLDSNSERQVQNAIQAAAQDRTTIVVAHRLSTIQHADCIFVLDKGMLEEKGTHEELVAAEGIYASMVRSQNLAA